jgi:hypothetical protein
LPFLETFCSKSLLDLIDEIELLLDWVDEIELLLDWMDEVELPSITSSFIFFCLSAILGNILGYELFLT